MERINTATRDVDKHGPGKDGFTDGNPGLGIPATHLADDWFDAVQEELANVIEGEGIPLAPATYTQLAEALAKMIGRSGGKGLFVGLFEYASASTVQLTRGLEGKIAVEIDDQIVVEAAADIVWDLTADLDTGSEANSTWYYPYLEVGGSGDLIPHISATGPIMKAATGKVGYHPGAGKEGWRALPLAHGSFLAFYNDSGGDIVPFDVSPDGVIFRRRPWADHSLSTTSAANPTFLSQSVTGEVPACAREMVIVDHQKSDDIYAHVAPDDAVGQQVSAYPASRVHWTQTPGGVDVQGSSRTFHVPILTPVTPAFAYANERMGSASVTERLSAVVGWR